jgi:D-lactate dehydrogenase
MDVAFFDSHKFEREVFESENKKFQHSLKFLESRLTDQTAVLVRGAKVVCAFANDQLDQKTLACLKSEGVALIALRSAGYNHVNLVAAKELGIKVVRVPAYSPHSVAEHAVGLIMALNRKVHRAYLRVREGNFSLDGLMGFDLHGKVVGVIGTGKIGSVTARILNGFGCEVLAFDLKPNPELVAEGLVKYVSLSELYKRSRVLTLHVPLNSETKHLINEKSLSQMQKGVILVNTGRGALIETKALIGALKSGHIGAAGLDVYEEEENIFFRDLSEQILQDDFLARLLTFPNVLITSHQGFLTEEALHNIATTTLQNITDFENGRPLINEVHT